jgi:SAM-dependent methyltransferase
VDSSEAALRQLSANTEAHMRGVAGGAMQLPFRANSFDAAIVLDSVASISSIQDLFEEVARVLRPEARLGCTAELGDPLTAAECALFTHSHPPTVLERNEFLDVLGVCGFETVEIHDCTRRTAWIARRLFQSIHENRNTIRRELGVAPVEDLVATLGTLADMLTGGRLQGVAVIAERRKRNADGRPVRAVQRETANCNRTPATGMRAGHQS